MQEEFHGNGNEGGTWVHKLLYGWGTMNANVWLPSLSELVGTTGNPADWSGCYYSAMQGLNTSTNHWSDAKGGNQFAYFRQFNASGGGEAIINACGGNSWCWTRSSVSATMEHVWQITNETQFDWAPITASYAVHPAAEDMAKKYASCTVQSVLEFFSIL